MAENNKKRIDRAKKSARLSMEVAGFYATEVQAIKSLETHCREVIFKKCKMGDDKFMEIDGKAAKMVFKRSRTVRGS